MIHTAIHTLSIVEALALWEKAQGLGKKPSTRKFHSEILAMIRANWPDPGVAVRDVTAAMVTDFATRIAHYSPSRWNAALSVLRSICPLQSRHLKRRRLRFRHFSPPSQLQFKTLLAQADNLQRSHAGLVIRFLALTGLRWGEAQSLRWENVYPERIEVPGSNAKNGRTRSVPLVAGMIELLERLRGLTEPTGYVLPRGNVRRGLAKACANAGLAYMSPHCFRHLFATRCIESGVDVPTVARWLGHQDGGALASRMYFHLLDEHSRTMAARVGVL